MGLRRVQFCSALIIATAISPGESLAAASPEYQTIEAARPEELTPTNGWPALGEYGRWERSLGGPTGDAWVAFALPRRQ